ALSDRVLPARGARRSASLRARATPAAGRSRLGGGDLASRRRRPTAEAGAPPAREGASDWRARDGDRGADRGGGRGVPGVGGAAAGAGRNQAGAGGGHGPG